MIEIVRIGPDFGRWSELLGLIRASFAYMEGVVDPPSSAHLLTPASLAQKARNEIAFAAICESALAGCIFCRIETSSLYVGKLAVIPGLQGKGLGRRLMARAEDIAMEKGLPALRIETRIELTDNHALFTHWGFEKIAENAHAGFDRTTSIEMRKLLG
nr:N-acetyltransferase [Rhizobium sp. Q54]